MKNCKSILLKIKRADDILGEVRRDIGLPNCPQMRRAHEEIKNAQLTLDDAVTYIEAALATAKEGK